MNWYRDNLYPGKVCRRVRAYEPLNTTQVTHTGDKLKYYSWLRISHRSRQKSKLTFGRSFPKSENISKLLNRIKFRSERVAAESALK